MSSGQDFYLAVCLNFSDELRKVFGDVEPINCVWNISSHAAELGALFDNYGLETLPGKAKGRIHAGYASTHDERSRIHRKRRLDKWSKKRGPGHRHPNQVFGLCGCSLRLLLVDPGILVADIGHLKEVFVQTAVFESLLEKRLMGPGRTGRYDDPVEPVLFYDLLHFLLAVLGAGEEVVGSVDHIRKSCGVLCNVLNIHHRGDVYAAVANKDADPGLLLRGVLLDRDFLYSNLRTPCRGKVDCRRASRRAGFHYGLRNVFGALEQPANVHPGA